MWAAQMASDDRYLDLSPTVLLVIGLVLVGLLVLCLVTDWAVGWFRTHFHAGHHR